MLDIVIAWVTTMTPWFFIALGIIGVIMILANVAARAAKPVLRGA